MRTTYYVQAKEATAESEAVQALIFCQQESKLESNQRLTQRHPFCDVLKTAPSWKLKANHLDIFGPLLLAIKVKDDSKRLYHCTPEACSYDLGNIIQMIHIYIYINILQHVSIHI